jgi:hypothetical protein
VIAMIDRSQVPPTFKGGVVRIPTGRLTPGRHRLELQVSDYQESRNMENATAILPNSAVLRTTVVVR